MYSKQEIVEMTGKKWHELSPDTKVAVNAELKQRDRDVKLGQVCNITIDRSNFFGQV